MADNIEWWQVALVILTFTFMIVVLVAGMILYDYYHQKFLRNLVYDVRLHLDDLNIRNLSSSDSCDSEFDKNK